MNIIDLITSHRISEDSPLFELAEKLRLLTMTNGDGATSRKVILDSVNTEEVIAVGSNLSFKVFEKVEYDDGTTLEIELNLSKKRQENPSESFAGTIPQVLIDIEIEDDYDEDEEEDEDLYVVCGDEENPQLVHKDIMDLYLEAMDDTK